ncbi:hypothetical protein MMC13_002746 [Lambiella insularis]|nr:hypothetical protein [Lambiella insularis]
MPIPLLQVSFPCRHPSDGLGCLRLHKQRRRPIISGLVHRLLPTRHHTSRRGRRSSDLSAEEVAEFCRPRPEELWWNSEEMRRRERVNEMRGLWDRVWGDGGRGGSEGGWEGMEGEEMERWGGGDVEGGGKEGRRGVYAEGGMKSVDGKADGCGGVKVENNASKINMGLGLEEPTRRKSSEAHITMRYQSRLDVQDSGECVSEALDPKVFVVDVRDMDMNREMSAVDDCTVVESQGTARQSSRATSRTSVTLTVQEEKVFFDNVRKCLPATQRSIDDMVLRCLDWLREGCECDNCED